MPGSVETATEVPREDGPSDWAVVDADVHPTVEGGLDALAEYMTSAWRRRFESVKLPLTRFDSSVGTLRKDAEGPSGETPGASPSFVRTDLLDEHEVLTALLVSLEAGRAAYLPGRGEAATAVAAYNDLLADRWLPEDARFRLAVTVSPRDPDRAAHEIRRWAGDQRVAGVYLPLTNLLLGEPYYYPIYAAAQDAQLPIISHPGTGEGEFQGAPTFAGGIPSTYAQRHVMLPQLAQSSVISLIFEGVLERFDRLQFVFAEYGFSWLPHIMWRMDKDWRNLRHQVPWVRRSPVDYVLERIRVTTQPMEEPVERRILVQLLDMMHAETTLMFSSDYPHWDNDFPRRTLVGVPADLRKRILVENARATLRL